MKKRIFYSILLTGVITLILTAGLMIPVLYQNFSAKQHTALESQAGMIAKTLTETSVDDVSYLKTIGTESGFRMTLISPDGTVLYDNSAPQDAMENHLDRPEVQSALSGGSGSDSRLSKTLAESTYYYAMRLQDGNVLRLSQTDNSTLGIFLSSASMLAFLLIAVVIITGVAANWISKAIITPINKLDLKHPLQNDTYGELSPLLMRLEHQRVTIEEQMTALAAQQREFHDITETMEAGLVIFSHDGHVLSSNASAQAFFADGITTGNYLELCREPYFTGMMAEALAGKAAHARVSKKGRVYELSVTPVDASDDAHGAVLFIIDVTEKENAEQLRREFSANVSHELKTPLTAIMGYAEIMEQGIAKEEDIRRFSGRIHDEAARLLALIKDIIRLSHLDEGIPQSDFETVDLYSLSRQVVADLQKKAADRKVDLRLIGGPVVVEGMSSTLYEMIYNLCDNAIAYNREGGQVDVDVHTAGGRPVVSVRDTGIGIAPEDQARVFERFFRVDKSHSKNTGGTGLGLSIVKHGALLHNAQVTLQSTPGEGSTFKLTF